MFKLLKMNSLFLVIPLLGLAATTNYGAVVVMAVVPFEDTYQKTCELPSFEWANYGNMLTGRMYTRRAAVLGDSLYAAGYLKSTGAPDKEGFVDVENDFCSVGPYDANDATGTESATAVCADLVSYTTEHGSYAQYEVGVVKIDKNTGAPQDIYVYYGEGQDETSGLAVKAIPAGQIMAVSGHFVGSLTADHLNDNGDKESSSTIYNSNAEGGADFVLHPNAIKNGYDDGFVIKADADTGHAHWIVAHPISNKDAQTVGVTIDTQGNIYGSGYACNYVGDEDSDVVCDGFVAKFAADDGSIVWEQQYPDLGAALWITYDETDDALYVTGTTSYMGESTDIPTDTKPHDHCNHDICAVTMRLSAKDGTTDWIRTVEGSPRWNFFDQTGDVELAPSTDGPYVYVALDDVGENSAAVTLDEGTPYDACRDNNNNNLTPSFEIITDRMMTAGDCPSGTTYVPRSYAAALAGTGAMCGTGHDSVDACIMKYHKYTGLPVWGADVHPIAGLAPAPDGQSLMVAGFYWHHNSYGNGVHFDSIELPDYNGVEGSFTAKLNTQNGQGEYVLHSGGAGKTRVYDIVGNTNDDDNANSDVYMVGYTQSAVIRWGGTLKTKIIEDGVDQNDDVGTAFQMGKVSTNTAEYQFFAVKLEASKPEQLFCVASCDYDSSGAVANSIIKDGQCLIDNACYREGATAEIFGRPCLVCNPNKSQTEWSLGDTVGDDVCFIDNVCRDKAEMYTYRKSRSEIYVSQCQTCDPQSDDAGWTTLPNFLMNTTADDVEPPFDCIKIVTITGGIEMMTDVQNVLDQDLIFKQLTDAMGDESCGALEDGRKIYNENPYFTSMPHYTDSKGVEMVLYEDFYGSGFLEKWVNAAFNNNKVVFTNSLADFPNLPGDTDGSGDCVGREEAVKKVIAYTSTYIDLNQYFTEAMDKIRDGCIWSEDLYTDGQLNFNPCTDAVHAFEKAIATWSGSIEGDYGRNLREPGETGKFLQALAEKRCVNFKTCGVSKDDSTSKGVTPRSNMNIISAFAKGRDAVFHGQRGLVGRIISEINKELTISRVQGVLRYAYRLGKNKSKKDKEIAEGAAFAFGLLPQIYACNKRSATILAANTDIGGENTSQQNGKSANFANVRAALECNYKCLGIRFSDVGELNDCVDSDDNKTLCFKKRSDKGNICKIKTSTKFDQKCAKVAPASNDNKTFAKTRFGTIGKKQFN